MGTRRRRRADDPPGRSRDQTGQAPDVTLVLPAAAEGRVSGFTRGRLRLPAAVATRGRSRARADHREKSVFARPGLLGRIQYRSLAVQAQSATGRAFPLSL